VGLGHDAVQPAFFQQGDRGSINPGEIMNTFLHKLWSNEQGQDVAEYSVMLAVILVIVVGTIRLIGSNASNVFSNVGSSIQ
jgi:Flp pilus assembly pilin Flp